MHLTISLRVLSTKENENTFRKKKAYNTPFSCEKAIVSRLNAVVFQSTFQTVFSSEELKTESSFTILSQLQRDRLSIVFKS
ncbi:hypothetical protein [Ulvibacter litoralis]|uniref:hypothetical protein n=1 Tax=Ulvibacter litoralis TaxID=227084 RepID=UPI0011130C3F|nr:hypothetical protein [Ulvibacter litoralis]